MTQNSCFEQAVTSNEGSQEDTASLSGITRQKGWVRVLDRIFEKSLKSFDLNELPTSNMDLMLHASFCLCLHVCVHMLGKPLCCEWGMGKEVTSGPHRSGAQRKGCRWRDVWRIHNVQLDRTVHVILAFGWRRTAGGHEGRVRPKERMHRSLIFAARLQHRSGFVKKPGFLWIYGFLRKPGFLWMRSRSPFRLFSCSFLQDELMPVTCWGIILWDQSRQHFLPTLAVTPQRPLYSRSNSKITFFKLFGQY